MCTFYTHTHTHTQVVGWSLLIFVDMLIKVCCIFAKKYFFTNNKLISCFFICCTVVHYTAYHVLTVLDYVLLTLYSMGQTGQYF